MTIVNGDFLWSALDAFDKVVLQHSRIPIFARVVCCLALCGIAFGFGAACKWICVYAGAGLLVLAQYSRQGQEAARGGVEPQLNWLRDCGSIENLAHVVAHLVRHEERGKPTESFLVCNQKHRNCPPFRVPLVWTGASYGMAAPSPNADAGDIPDGGVDF